MIVLLKKIKKTQNKLKKGQFYLRKQCYYVN
jgi:hypothetical protein